MDNFTGVTMFTLSGLSGITNYRFTLFALSLLCYCVIWIANMTIIVTVIVEKSLHEPMYIFLCNLCINGLYGTSGFYPKFLSDLLSTSHVISYAGCLLQDFVLHSSACADFSILAMMAFDRYVAICRPLVYHSVMSTQRVCVFVVFSWCIPFYLMSISVITTSTLRLCGSHIPKLYCVKYLVAKIACSAPKGFSFVMPAFNYTFYVGHFLLVVWSYMYLIRTCRASKEGRKKFMQTCLPHLVCLVIVVVCLLFDRLYMRFGSYKLPQSVKVLIEMEFLLIPPIINPLIYGFKLTKIRNHISVFLCCKNSIHRKKMRHPHQIIKSLADCEGGAAFDFPLSKNVFTSCEGC